ncbi:MAG TPA: hypothetical protein VLC95_11685, partial [Anaerolineae bacterium]|nr:hypothetical protein [Anaerolineae bacterium]
PPPNHFGPSCESCHTPTTFADATLPPELHPVPLIGAHAEASCDGCHVEGGVTPEYICENCHERPENHLDGTCDVCHTPEGWAESAERFVRIAPEIPHDVEGREDCLLCHDPEGDIQPAPETHEEYTSEQCGLCHKVAGE